ncbi:hypothetical protein RI367_008066 [Sorochytrium milnesiophthora]
MATLATTPSLTISDARSGKSIVVPIDTTHNVITASALKQLPLPQDIPAPPAGAQQESVPCTLYDPGFTNTVACRSNISQAEGATGQLYLRGYSIEELVEKSTYLEVAYLLINGALPTKAQYDEWQGQIMRHTYLHTELERQLQTFRYDAHPMGMVISTLASLSTFHPEANPALVGDALYLSGPRENLASSYKVGTRNSLKPPSLTDIRDHVRSKQIYRILGKVPSIAACAYRLREGRPLNHPMNNADSYTQNFLYMLDRLDEDNFRPDEVLVKALDKMFILLAEHGSSCSTIMMRHLISSGVDPYSALSGAFGALFGERKASAVIHMLTKQIGSVDNIPAFLSAVKEKRFSMDAQSIHQFAAPTPASPQFVSAKNMTATAPPPLRLMGFGHRIYKVQDPRVKLAKGIATDLFKHLYPDAPEPSQPSAHLIHLAFKLEEAVLADGYFTSRGLYPNIDYWTAIVFHVMGFPDDMFPVLLSIPRTAGYIAHAFESLSDKEYKIFRPRQLYLGHSIRPYIKVEERQRRDNRQSLVAVGAKSNPTAQMRRDVGSEQVQSVEQISKLIDRTRSSIMTLTQEIQTAMVASPTSASGTDSRSSGSSEAGNASPGTARRKSLRRLWSGISLRSGPTTPGTAAGMPFFSTADGGNQPLSTKDLAEQMTRMGDLGNQLQTELQALMDKQRELLQFQKLQLQQDQHLTDEVDLDSFSQIGSPKLNRSSGTFSSSTTTTTTTGNK